MGEQRQPDTESDGGNHEKSLAMPNADPQTPVFAEDGTELTLIRESLARFLPLFLALAALLAACEKEPIEPTEKLDQITTAPTPTEVPEPSTKIAPEPEEMVTVTGEFGTKGQLPTPDGEPTVVEVSESVAQTMTDEAAERFTAIALRRGLEDVTVELGGEGPDGLRMIVKHAGKEATVHIPPAQHPAEAVTNLDHTFERALGELE